MNVHASLRVSCQWRYEKAEHSTLNVLILETVSKKVFFIKIKGKVTILLASPFVGGITTPIDRFRVGSPAGYLSGCIP